MSTEKQSVFMRLRWPLRWLAIAAAIVWGFGLACTVFGGFPVVIDGRVAVIGDSGTYGAVPAKSGDFLLVMRTVAIVAGLSMLIPWAVVAVTIRRHDATVIDGRVMGVSWPTRTVIFIGGAVLLAMLAIYACAFFLN